MVSRGVSNFPSQLRFCQVLSGAPDGASGPIHSSHGLLDHSQLQCRPTGSPWCSDGLSSMCRRPYEDFLPLSQQFGGLALGLGSPSPRVALLAPGSVLLARQGPLHSLSDLGGSLRKACSGDGHALVVWAYSAGTGPIGPAASFRSIESFAPVSVAGWRWRILPLCRPWMSIGYFG